MKEISWLRPFVAWVATLLLCDPAAAQLSPAQIDELAARSLSTWATPGLAVSVIDGEGSPLARGYGVRDASSSAPVSADTLFAIGSCTKSFATATAASLVDRGTIDWDTRVQAVLPWFAAHDPWVTRELTLRDILSHRAGLRASIPRQAAPSRRIYLESIALARPVHAFRAEFGYANDMFTLAGEVLAETAQRRWEDEARVRFWAPLGMTRTNLDFRAARRDRDSATPHLITAAGIHAVPWVYEEDVAAPSGGINSTARDMAQWIRFQLSDGELDGRRLLSSASMREMHSAQTVMRGAGAEPQRAFSRALGEGEDGIRFESYAMGWYVHDFRGHTIVWHLGAIPGFRCVMGFLPEQQFGVAILTNVDASMQPIALFQDLVEARLEMPDRNWTAVALEADRASRQARRRARAEQDAAAGVPASPDLAEFTGAYTPDSGTLSIEARFHRGALILQFGRVAYSASPWQDDRFRLTPVRWRVGGETIAWPYPTREEPLGVVVFERDENGTVVALQTDFGRFHRRPP